ncbi:biotin transporter BioY [Anaerosporobacter sp.]|uniref:biotin transporter BioY n=1 Tax=Anaerosporobacter sp. TaxID=1872529 RepID=UPI00286F3486|nr:biotin transporter BioY [Anaerosporobacter sp.]
MKEKLTTQDLCLSAIFTVLTAVCAQIAIPLPISPVPISFGMVGVYTAAIFLKPKCAVISQVCYLLLGAVGMPVFGGFRGGVGALIGPTGGYLLVYPIIVAIIACTLNGRRALLAERKQRQVVIKGGVSICIAHLVLYVSGTAWLSATTGNTFIQGLSLAVFPYVPMDIVKIVFCILVIIPLRKRFMKMGLLNVSVKATNMEGRKK